MVDVHWDGVVGVRAWVVAALLSLAVAVAPAHALQAGATAEEASFWGQAGLGAAAALGNFAYMPIKLAYAAAGSVVGAAAYVVTLGSAETANAIWEPTLGGNYVITPRGLAGKEDFYFNGQPPLPPAQQGFSEPDSEWGR